MKTKDQVNFNNWNIELDARWLEFQARDTCDNKEDYWMHRNCVMYDYEILRLSQFTNPCRSCSIPLHATKNFEIYGTGPVCGLCYTLHSIINLRPYFQKLHREWKENKDKKDSGEAV